MNEVNRSIIVQMSMSLYNSLNAKKKFIWMNLYFHTLLDEVIYHVNKNTKHKDKAYEHL